MPADEISRLLDAVAAGQLSPTDAAAALQPALTTEQAVLDLERDRRCGQPEVVFGAGKSDAQLHEIVAALLAANRNVLVTRIRPEIGAELATKYPDAIHDDLARTWTCRRRSPPRRHGTVAVISAGSSDAPVAGEAARTLEFLGIETRRYQDIGVAGIHRLFGRLEEIRTCDIVLVVAGMEGALPSVVGGLVKAPVIAVPTSVGYGASFQGLAALLGMLNSCAAGITVVNIDNGFGAASAAARMLQLTQPEKTP